MKPKVSIVVLVDAVGALSDRTLHNGNLSLVDDSPLDSAGAGTPDLVTAVVPGQVVQWTAIAVDVQTPVEIQSIEFTGAGPVSVPSSALAAATAPGYAPAPAYESGAPAYGDGAVAVRTAAPAVPAAPRALGPSGIENLDLLVWEGIVPVTMTPGVPYRYRLAIKIHEGENSMLAIDSPALLRV